MTAGNLDDLLRRKLFIIISFFSLKRPLALENLVLGAILCLCLANFVLVLEIHQNETFETKVRWCSVIFNSLIGLRTPTKSYAFRVLWYVGILSLLLYFSLKSHQKKWLWVYIYIYNIVRRYIHNWKIWAYS